MKNLLFLPLFVLMFWKVDAQPLAGEGLPGDIYGDGAGFEQERPVLDLLNMEEDEVYKGLFTGRVEEVCQKKGCWIRLVLKDGQPATIKMKDYGFFVPLALVDKNILIDGRAERTITSVEELQHLAEDGGKSQEEIDAITEPKETLTILANGIRVIE